MSQDNQTHIPDAPQASRRALLMGFAAAATPMAPALANALSESAPAAAADPIFEVIKRHKAACDTARAVGDVLSEVDPCDPNYEALLERFGEAIKPERRALVALLICRPTTLAGVVAVLDHVGRADWVHGVDFEETILIDAHERQIEEAKAFPKHLATALRTIIEQGQA